jgi:hypothetical protein
MEEFCSGMPPSYSQLEPESTASHIAAAGRLKDGDEGASKPEFRLPFLPGTGARICLSVLCELIPFSVLCEPWARIQKDRKEQKSMKRARLYAQKYWTSQHPPLSLSCATLLYAEAKREGGGFLYTGRVLGACRRLAREHFSYEPSCTLAAE